MQEELKGDCQGMQKAQMMVKHGEQVMVKQEKSRSW